MKRRMQRVGVAGFVAAGVAGGALAATGLAQKDPGQTQKQKKPGQMQKGSIALAGRVVLDVEDYDVGPISEVSRLKVEWEQFPSEPVERGAAGRKSFGRDLPPIVEIRRLLSGNYRFHEWYVQARAGKADARRNATITVYSAGGKAVARWALDNAWPIRLSVTPMPGKDESRALIETVRLTADAINRVPAGS